MNVWVRKTRKKANCYYCGKEIETGTYQIVCQYFMPLKSSKRVWTKRMLFHAAPKNCWLERAIVELESRPVNETRGRKPIDLSDPIREQRNKVLRRRASVIQRLEREMYGKMRPVKLLHMTQMLENLKVEIEPLGGIPETWN